MDVRSLKRLLPRDKDDADGARVLVALGHPKVAAVLPEMLDWLKANGSPVELVMREFFVALGASGVPVVQRALASRHESLKYFVVLHVVMQWPADAIAALRVQLQAVASGSGSHGTDLLALRVLVEHRLADRAWLEQWARFKTRRLRDLLSQAEEIEALLAS